MLESVKLFKKNKGSNRLLKLSKAVTQSEAESFDTKSLIELLLSIFQSWELQLNSFYITGPYPNQGWKTKEGFLNGLKKKDYKHIHHLIISDFENQLFLDFENWSHNRTIEVESDSISFELMTDKNLLTEEELISFSSKIYPILNFEYGYIFEQSKKYSIDEAKIKNGIFSVSTAQNPNYEKWLKYQSATKYGYLRSIYEVNFLSPQHLENEQLKSTIDSFGKLVHHENLNIWKLERSEVEQCLTRLEKSNYLVENSEFNKTEMFEHINREIKKYAPQQWRA